MSETWEEYAYRMGMDCAINFATAINCRYAIFDSRLLLKAWEAGYAAGKDVKSKYQILNKPMKVTIESTTKIVQLNGVPTRVWEGNTESGIPVHCFVSRIATDKDNPQSEFQKELNQYRAPSAELEVYPLKMIL